MIHGHIEDTREKTTIIIDLIIINWKLIKVLLKGMIWIGITARIHLYTRGIS
jgi:hypothetical protein